MKLQSAGNSLPINSETENLIKTKSGCEYHNLMYTDSEGESKPYPREVGVCYLTNEIKCLTKGIENIIWVWTLSLDDLCENPLPENYSFLGESSQKSSRGCFWLLCWLSKFWR